ncbi:hypothetical protein [Nitrospira sp. Nam80]
MNGSITIQRQEPFDQVSIHFQDDEPAKYASFIAAVYTELQAIDSKESIERILGSEVAEFYRQREETLVRLENLSQKLIEQNEEYRRKKDAEADTLRQTLIAEREDDKKQIETIRLQGEESLKLRLKQLEEREKQLDDRSSRHARRQLRQDLKQAVAARGGPGFMF